MKKAILLFVVILLLSQSLVPMHAQETMYNANFLVFTETVLKQLQDDLNLTRDESVTKQLENILIGEAQELKANKDQKPNLNYQKIFFGPNYLSYLETSRSQTITDMYGAFHDQNQPIYQALESLKKKHNLPHMNPYIITETASFAKKSENIVIRNGDWIYSFANFLKRVTPTSWDEPIQAFTAPMPEKYRVNQTYGTYGTRMVDKLFENFEYKGDSLVHFTNDDGQPDSVIFSMGNRNVVDLFAWDNICDTGIDLGFETNPDTATIKAERFCIHDFRPTWNDYCTDSIRYASGGNFGKYEDEREAQFLCAFKTGNPKVGEFLVLAYAVKIKGIPGAFALDYILVQFVEDITYPSIDRDNLPIGVKAGQVFTIYLKGDYDLMTSWIPEFQVSGITYEIISQTNHSVTVKAVTSGTATITLHHNSLLVLDDETVTVDVESDIQIPARIQTLLLEMKGLDRLLTWDAQDDVTYTVYIYTQGSDTTVLAEGLTSPEYLHTEELPNNTYYYVVTASNEAGTSDHSNEVHATITSVEDYFNTDTEIKLFPNPTTQILNMKFSLKENTSIHISVRDMAGRVMDMKDADGTDILVSFDVSDYSSGVYFLDITFNGETTNGETTNGATTNGATTVQKFVKN
jgi:type IX secretion system substrate protein